MGFLSTKPGFTDAYHVDAAGDEYHGRTLKGSTVSSPRWQIMKVEHTGKNWIVKFAEGSDEPKFQWDLVETYTYRLLGT